VEWLPISGLALHDLPILQAMVWKLSFIMMFFVSSGNTLLKSQQLFWKCNNGHVAFESAAPLEVIKAESNAVRGIVSPETKSFAFTMEINSFQGFNSDIQQTHFLENYLEWKKYPEATFTGKLIEDIPFDVPGTYSVRAKGNLDIHGITRERIIRGTLIVRKDGGRIQTDFSIPVSDHGITIPKIVQQKISDDIQVRVSMNFTADRQS
jgi:hypothetical protein